MVDTRRILEILDDQLSVHPVSIWLRVSQKYDLSIILVPREELFRALRRLRDDEYIREILVGESNIEFLLTVKGVQRKREMLVFEADEYVHHKDPLHMVA